MYFLRSMMSGLKFLSQGVIIKSLFCLSSSNTFSWFMFNLPVDFFLFALYRFHSSLEKLYINYYDFGNFSIGVGM